MFATLLLTFTQLAADPAPKSAKEALQPFNLLVGSWKATGTPDGTREERQKGFWSETLTCEWHFKGHDVWVTATFEKGKQFKKWELRYVPAKAAYQLTATTAAGDTHLYTGLLTSGKQREQILTVERFAEKENQTQRLVVTLLHHNRFLYRLETKPAGGGTFARRYQVGATKEGEAFAQGDGAPECIVSSGKGTIPVSYKGRKFFVCCSGCRDEFNGDPEKYIREYEAKQKGKK